MVLGVTTACFAQKADMATDASQAAAKTIFDYQKDLKLSDKQVADIKALMSDLQKALADKAKDMKEMRQALVYMIKNKEDMKGIRKQLEKIAMMQVDNSCLDIETSRKVESVLTSDQWTKWKDIQIKAVEEAAAKAKARAAKQAPAPKKAPAPKGKK
jgi:hypothetical protein